MVDLAVHVEQPGSDSVGFRFASPDQFEQVERFTKRSLAGLKD